LSEISDDTCDIGSCRTRLLAKWFSNVTRSRIINH
jgi:hypothetical protein